MAEIASQLPGAAIPARWLLLQAFQTDRFQIQWHAGIKTARRVRVGILDLMKHLVHRFALERRPASQQMIQHRPERIDIARPTDQRLFAKGLLRRDVAWGAE